MRNAQAHGTGTEAFEKRLRAYAAGAGAAAAGLLALSPNAAAEIVVTQTHVFLEKHSSPFPISIEGITEFTLSVNSHTVYGDSLYSLKRLLALAW